MKLKGGLYVCRTDRCASTSDCFNIRICVSIIGSHIAAPEVAHQTLVPWSLHAVNSIRTAIKRVLNCFQTTPTTVHFVYMC